MKRKIGIGTHILAVLNAEPFSISQLFPKELSGSTIEIISTNGNWVHKEVVLYQNNSFSVS